MKPEKVAAVVVTYNRKELLRECLGGILSQTRPVDALIIVDNHSTDGTPESLKQLSFIHEIPYKLNDNAEISNVVRSTQVPGRDISVHYVRTRKNIGGAGGFHEGMKRACGKGYNWV